MRLFLCEKPSQARDIATVLGSARKNGTSIQTAQGVVTWAIGHLLELQEPEKYDARYIKWCLDDLPLIPRQFSFNTKRGRGEHLRSVIKLIKQASEIVIATDADREGEMIAREILEKAHYRGKVSRLWLSALDEKSIQKALDNLKDGAQTEPLFHAARARSCADWLVGMNLTRALTKAVYPAKYTKVLSIGRVQTPTLALVVKRDIAIENFSEQEFYTLAAEVETQKGEIVPFFYRPEEKIFNRMDAELIAKQCTSYHGPIGVERKVKKQAPPKLFHLAGFQKTANACFGWGAKKALDVLQALYETHKAISYPRTDCCFLPNEQSEDVEQSLKVLSKVAFLAPLFSASKDFQPIVRNTIFDSSKITAHHAIIPTTGTWSVEKMSMEEQQAFQLIAERYVAMLLPDYECIQVTYSMMPSVLFKAVGYIPITMGWKSLEKQMQSVKSGTGEGELPNIEDQDPGTIRKVFVKPGKTSPPDYYTEGTLIGDMESVGKFVLDPKLKETLKEVCGIGTEATRASVLETLLKRKYIEIFKQRNKPYIRSTAEGRFLIECLETRLPELVDPGQTAVWEQYMEAIVDGKNSTEAFLGMISGQIKEQINILKQNQNTMSNVTELDIKCPKSGEPVKEYEQGYRFEGFPESVFPKQISGRDMNAEDYLKILTEDDGVFFTGFVSKKAQNPFDAKLWFNPEHSFNGKRCPGIEFVFDSTQKEKPAAKQLDVKCPKSGAPVREFEKHFEFEGFPNLFCWKEISGRKMTTDDYVNVLDSEEGSVLDGFVSRKTGRNFSAKLKYQADCARLNGKPGFDMAFE